MPISRRTFNAAASAATLTGLPLLANDDDKKAALNPLPFGPSIEVTGKPVQPRVQPFALSEVRLLPGVFKTSEDANVGYLKRLNADRLLHNFRVNAGLPSTVEPLGGWEKPDCELRGHFVGHYLSACALTYASLGDADVKARGDYLVAELAKCQDKLGGGYLSAFPLSYFDRVKARTKVWAPFYTVHKIMAGLLDMHTLADNRQALVVLEGMAKWADTWTAAIPEPHMQHVLETEYGGMNDLLYKLAAVTGNTTYIAVGDRFTKKKFFNPLAMRRDELRGLHVNTHIPQVIGAAQRYELTGDTRFHDVADFFWWDVTTGRSYVTGGTSNNEAWLEEPRRLGAELKRAVDTTEDCCAYNMLKLTRQLYSWTADPRYFDYYERTLWNHRLPAIDRRTGATQYYLSLAPAAWKTFNTENDSFWCCTGTGVEEFSKLGDSIYFQDATAVYANLFIPSELHSKDKGFALRQETAFPESPVITFTILQAPSDNLPLHIRIPSWAGPDASLAINGHADWIVPTAGSYLALNRKWKAGDKVVLRLPMRLHVEAMPDDASTQAFLYGPIVLAGQLGADGIRQDMVVGPMAPKLKENPLAVPPLLAAGRPIQEWMHAEGDAPLSFAAGEIRFKPLYQTFGQRYSVYWQVT